MALYTKTTNFAAKDALASGDSNKIVKGSEIGAEFDNIQTAFAGAIAANGSQAATANIPIGGFKLTNLAAGSANGDSLRYEQLFSTSAVTLLGAMNWVKAADIASAGTLNLTTAAGNAAHVTGTTTITAVTLASGKWFLAIFDSALTLTHHATNNNLPGSANITTAAGDRALYWSDGTTVYCVSYIRAATGATVSKQPTRQVFASGSGTYTTPAGATRINVRMVGGGSGGNGSGGAPGTPGAGGNTTFGSSLLTAPGGAAGSGIAPGGGGTAATINSPAFGFSIPTSSGHGGGQNAVANVLLPGGAGAASPLGGAGKAGPGNVAGSAAQANSGSGGGGAGAASAANAGAGGDAGAFIDAWIISPSATYAYAVGAAGSAAAGGNGGGAGAAGIIIVDEYYN